MTAKQTERSDAQSLAAITEVDRQVFQHLITHGPTSRAALSAEIGVSRPTASESAKRLLRSKLISQTGTQSGQRGRVPVLYGINAARGHVLSLALDHDWIGLRICDLARQVVWERIDTTGPDITPERLIIDSRALLAEGRRHATGECVAITCSVADPVDPRTGQVLRMPNSPFAAGHIDIGQAVFELAPEQLRVDNDVNWAALAESRIGLMRCQPNFVYIFIGAGIGAALYVNGAVYRGTSGLAGEIGHTQVAPGKTLVQRLIELEIASPVDASIDSDQLIEAFEHRPDSPQAEAVIDAIARAIANTLITLNPGAMVLAGRIIGNAGFSSQLRQAVLQILPSPIDIHETSFGPHAPLLGATLGAQERGESYLNLRA